MVQRYVVVAPEVVGAGFVVQETIPEVPLTFQFAARLELV